MRTTGFVNGEYYHVYNRGNSKQVIFHDSGDYLYFQKLLSCMNTEVRIAIRELPTENQKEDEALISIGAYCLMPNHFHILIKQEKEAGISKFMQKLSTSYVMYYNKKYNRTGGLFEGKFKSKYAAGDIYLKYLFSYIHLNPLKIIDDHWKMKVKNQPTALFDYLTKYPFSSFNEYYRDAYVVVDRAAFPDYFPTKVNFLKETISWFDSSLSP